jgi:Fe-S-cluster containining protein
VSASAAPANACGLTGEPFAALAEIYARLDAEIAARNPRCELSGRCCDFPTSGHRLYASDLETDFAVAAAGGRVPEAASGLCPWHVEGRCTQRQGRPLGCRVYFCDPGFADEMPHVYERYHAEVRALHERHGLPYDYREFVEAVRP